MRTLVLHCHKLQNAKSAFHKLLKDDTALKKKATSKAKGEYDSLKRVDRYMVFNGRTGQMASQDWLARHIQCVDGKPQLKKSTSTARPWILTLGFALNGQEMKLTLKTCQDQPAARVRCFDLRHGCPNGKFKFIMLGYQHMGGEEWENDGKDQDEAAEPDSPNFEDDGYESADSIVNDEQGLEGWRPKTEHVTVSLHPFPDSGFQTV